MDKKGYGHINKYIYKNGLALHAHVLAVHGGENSLECPACIELSKKIEDATLNKEDK